MIGERVAVHRDRVDDEEEMSWPEIMMVERAESDVSRERVEM